ncbi:hypothetical protein GCM10009721_25330 [Terrabacter tumescens]|uniref:ESX secretion-associated protein EspG n=1 Tax=Terrabacter tumescens TaxID=60443 RepID=A0ABQ2I3J6_9MICO|nr:hypothetical protein [Terrabacter tumescens]GGM97303.1 hypothetical protein GCM10009721_25330 [Terrabacter tumescens]
MADPMKGTPLEGFELPDDVFGLGAAELAYLMARHETPAGERSRRLLMLDPRSADDAALLAGASSLASRGWLTVTDDGEAQTRSNAALVEYAVGAATRWTRVGLVGENASQMDFAILVESDTVIALMQPRQLASWFIRLGERNGETGALVTGLVKERFAANPESGVFLEVQTLEGSSNLAVRRSGSGFEALADVAGPGTGTGGIVDAEGLQAAVSALYTEVVSA